MSFYRFRHPNLPPLRLREANQEARGSIPFFSPTQHPDQFNRELHKTFIKYPPAAFSLLERVFRGELYDMRSMCDA